jgi:GT2 family glycosyltransferase
MTASDSSGKPTCGVVVVNYNSMALLEQNLAHADFGDDVIVVVVDNSDSMHEKPTLRRLALVNQWVLLDPGGNLGFGAAVNLGVLHVLEQGCDWILLLNPDATIARSQFEALMTTQRSEPRAIMSPVIQREDGSVWFRGAELRRRVGMAVHSRELNEDSEWLSGACLSIPASVWNDLGGMSSAYFLYWEDVDFTYRWRQRGGALVVATAATAVHSVGGTQAGVMGKSMTFVYYNCRNRLVFAARNLGTAYLALWILTSPYQWFTMLRLSRFRRSGQKAAIAKAILTGYSAGIWLAIRGRSAGKEEA